MSWIACTPFVLLSLIVIISPGPTVVLVQSRALEGSRRRSASVIAGISVLRLRRA
ncbi:MAG: hypothetical protein ACJ79S_09720 [Gemmatimonadaceae bacterium]